MFKDLKPFEKAEFAIMLALVFAIPFHWFAAQVGEALLLLCAFLKVAFEQKFHFNKDQMRYKWVYAIYACTWLIYLIGMLYTKNQWFGWTQVSKKLGFLIFPAIFLFSDMSYLNKQRMKAIGYAFVAGCLMFFLFHLSYAIYDVLFNGAGSERFFDEQLMKVYCVQHSYLAMYAGLGLMFCFAQIFDTDSRKIKIINILMYAGLVLFIILVRSRAGLLWMIVTFILQWIWLTFILKKKKTGLYVGVFFVVSLTVVWMAFPQSFSRITMTIYDLRTENRSDHRLVQYRGYEEVIDENWIFGVGTGDRVDAVNEAYYEYKAEIVEQIGPEVAAEIDKLIDGKWYEPSPLMRESIKKKAVKYGRDPEMVDSYLVEYLYINYAIVKETNAHNMFMDTLISVGIVGLLLLLAYFVIPIVLWIKQRRFDMIYFSFLMMMFFNAMFESVFERQQGIIFFCFFNALFFTVSFRPKQNEMESAVEPKEDLVEAAKI